MDLPDTHIQLQHDQHDTRGLRRQRKALPDCALLREIVPSRAHPDPTIACARFNGLESCCRLHRIGRTPCRYSDGRCYSVSDPTSRPIGYGAATCQWRHASASGVTAQMPDTRHCAMLGADMHNAGPVAARAGSGPGGFDPSAFITWRPEANFWNSSTPCDAYDSIRAVLQRATLRMVNVCVAPPDRASDTGGNMSLRAITRAFGKCRGLPRCGKACPLAFCQNGRRCFPKQVARLSKAHCLAKHMEPASLAHMALDRPMMVGRSGNGELLMMLNLATLIKQGNITRFSDFFRFRLNDPRTDALHGFVFNSGKLRALTMQLYAARPAEDLPMALDRFVLEYSRAAATADIEMLWGTQCHSQMALRCGLQKIGMELSNSSSQHGAKRTLRYSERIHRQSWTTSLSELSNMSRMINYNVSLSYWLEVLETFARRRARLLVVTGFAASVRHQLPKLHLIHPRHNLSGLRIRVLAAPMAAPRMGTPEWPLPTHPKDENYAHYLDQLIASPEWDPRINNVALLGCGPFGLPLARHAREKGVSSIYVAGLVTLLFGITGRRYVENLKNGTASGGLADEVFRPGTINEHWRPPLDVETPHNFRTLEGGAYW